ncbi:hypothetical protein [Shewanella colwelliana]|uniref:hypothetical protein n=1 Tax=Shewanella colwelliana TaxID=23 RepID=UPI0022B06844|nr:hypothetical protein [Shewanella colwelliana]MCZ4337823.1 hypothetical protein [Shewanella colwelliana]
MIAHTPMPDAGLRRNLIVPTPVANTVLPGAVIAPTPYALPSEWGCDRSYPYAPESELATVIAHTPMPDAGLRRNLIVPTPVANTVLPGAVIAPTPYALPSEWGCDRSYPYAPESELATVIAHTPMPDAGLRRNLIVPTPVANTVLPGAVIAPYPIVGE